MRKHATWEARCNRCGQCCYEKIEYEGDIYYTDEPCEFLDTDTKLCQVYATRHQQKSDCSPLTPRQVGRGLLPKDCPYVANIEGYRGPQLWDEDET